MNQQLLQAKLLEILSSIQAAVKAAGDFALDQIPDIAYQYIAFGRAYYTFIIILAIFGISIGLWLFIKKAIYGIQKNILYDGYDGWSDNRSAALTGGVLFILIFSVVFLNNIYDTFMVWFAPKIWLIKEIAVLIK